MSDIQEVRQLRPFLWVSEFKVLGLGGFRVRMWSVGSVGECREGYGVLGLSGDPPNPPLIKPLRLHPRP